MGGSANDNCTASSERSPSPQLGPSILSKFQREHSIQNLRQKVDVQVEGAEREPDWAAELVDQDRKCDLERASSYRWPRYCSAQPTDELLLIVIPPILNINRKQAGSGAAALPIAFPLSDGRTTVIRGLTHNPRRGISSEASGTATLGADLTELFHPWLDADLVWTR